MNYINDCLQQFNNLPENIKSVIGGEKAVQIVDGINKKYKIDVSFLIVLVAIGEIDIDEIPEYIIAKFKLEKISAEEVRNLLVSEIFSTKIAEQKPAIVDNSENVMVADIKNIFSTGLNKIFASSFEDQDELNAKIIYLTAVNENLNEEMLFKILLDSSEQLIETPILLEKKKVVATVSNWMKDFIKNLGTEIFDNVVMTKYLTTSENCKKLNSQDREKVKNLLLLYRNLRFFPISQGDKDPDEWEIIPENRELVVDKRYEKTLSIPKTTEEKTIEQLVAKKQELGEANLAGKVVEEEIDNTKKVEELKIMLNKYKDNSLQKRAIEEEIRKFENK
jgi:hypothetical protein